MDLDRALVRLAPEPLAVLDRGGVVLRANPAALEVLGADAVGRPLVTLVSPPAAVVPALQRALAGERSEVVAEALDGWGSWTFEADAPTGAVLLAGRSLLAHHRSVGEAIADAFSASPVAWAVLRPDGTMAWANAALEAMAGTPEGGLAGRRLSDVEDRVGDALAAAERRALALGALDGLRADRRFRHPDGRVVRARLTASMVRQPDGGPGEYVCQFEDVTRRMQALDRLAASEAKLAEAQQIARLGSWEWDVVADHVTWSDELHRIHGLRPDSTRRALGSEPDAIHADDRERVRRTVETAIAERRGWALSYRIVRGDGEVRVLDARGECVLGEDGEPALVRGTCQDVTEGRRVEDALRAAEQLFRRAFDDAPTGMALLDADRRWLRVNAALCRILGRTEGELRAERFDDLVLEEDREGDRADQQELLDGRRRTAARELRLRHAAGMVVHVQQHASVLRGEGDRPRLFLVQVVDLTERRRAEDERRESEQRLQAIVDNAPALIALTDVRGRLVLVNARWEELHGMRAQEVLGRRQADVLPDQGAVEAEELASAVVADAQPREVLLTLRDTDGDPVQLLALQFPVFDARGRVSGSCLMATDVTERRRSAEERAELEGRLARSQRLETVGRLAGGVAHDFNNLLSVIQTCAAFALKALDEEHEVREDVEEIRGAAERASALVRQLLVVSRREVVQPRLVDVRELVLELEPLLRRPLTERHRLELDLADALPPVLADPSRLEQVLLNLVLNARDALPEAGGTVAVVAQPTLAGGLRLVVRDDGSGMTPDVAARAFEPFYTTKGSAEGTGLGLATVESIVADSGGSVELTTRRGEGTAVTIELPAAEPDAAAPVAPPEEVPAPQRGSGRILLVEDQDPVRRQARRILVAAGYDVADAADGEAGLELLDGADLLLTDVVMPGMSGRDLAVAALERSPGLRVVFMSGHTEDVLLRDGIREGDVGFVQKPFSEDTLLRAVALALAPEAIG